jgi:hypothetical protein
MIVPCNSLHILAFVVNAMGRYTSWRSWMQGGAASSRTLLGDGCH